MNPFDVPYIAITDAVAGHAAWYPDRTALVCGERRLTWRELNGRVNRVANTLLAAGLRKGDAVAALMGNCVEMVEVMLGTIKAGGVTVPLSPMATGEALARLVEDSGARVLVAACPYDAIVAPVLDSLPGVAAGARVLAGAAGDAGNGAAAGWVPYDAWLGEAANGEPGVRLSPDDTFNIMYTSGTTGVPKGIVHTHYARQQFALLLGIEVRFEPTAVAVVTTPLYSNGTWIMLLPALTIGATTVVMEKFDPRLFLEIARAEGGTHTFMVPPQYAAILGLPDVAHYDVSSLRTLVSAGAALSLTLKEAILARFGGRLFELYGLTEGIATTLRPDAVARKLASVGTPMLGTDIRIVDDEGRELPRGETGEIVGYGPVLMRGYHKRPDLTAEAIWRDEAGRTYLKTGDIGRLDAEGYLYILDRKKDMIVSGGANVYPSDIEAALLLHPAVADVAVIGVPSERWGETPLALVVRAPGAVVSAEDLAGWVNARVAKHQRVSGVEFRAEIPHVPPLGKVPKRDLRAPYWGQ